MAKGKEKNHSGSGNSYIVSKIYVYLFLCLSYAICSVALIYLSKKYYVPISICDEQNGILDTIIDELGNSITFTSGLLCMLIDFVSEKEKQIGAWTKRFVAFSLFLQFNFCRCANALKLTANQFSVILLKLPIPQMGLVP